MTDMEIGMETLIKVFHRYATKDGNGKSLNKKGLRTLLENEVPTFLKVRVWRLLSLTDYKNHCP